MSEYEFWDELGNIFNAIVAYQEKTIEFNKRFVNPWLRLGPVFDQNDHVAEALQASKKALEIDPANASNWLSLGDVYFKMGSWDDAADAYGKAIELNPKLGWAYANLALTNATRQKYTEAINLYIKSLELIGAEKERAMIWNRLGEVYRRVNDYENASIAFKMADESDGGNRGIQDTLDEAPTAQSVMPILAEVYVNNGANSSTDETVAVAEESVKLDEPVVESTGAEPASAQIEESVSEPIAAENAVVEEQTGEATSTDDTAAVETTEITQPEAISDENISDESSAPELSTEVETNTQLDELQALIELVEQGPSVQTPAAEDNTEQVEASIPATEAEQTVVEDQVGEEAVADVVEVTPATEAIEADAPAEAADGAPVEESTEESVRDEAPLESAPEIPAEDVEVVAESQPEAVEETQSTDTVIEEAPVEMAAENLLEESAVGEAQLESVEETPVEVNQTQLVEETVTTQPETAAIDVSTETTMTPVMTHDVATFADPSAANQGEELAEAVAQVAEEEDAAVETPAAESEDQVQVQVEVVEAPEAAEAVEAQLDPVGVTEEVADAVAEAEVVSDEIQSEAEALPDQTPEPVAESADEPVAETVSESVVADSNEPAYDEFLQNAAQPVATVDEPEAEMLPEPSGEASPVKAGLKVKPDSKNAHVWNELGNIYFNAGSFDDAVSAYNKAIELDGWFAWPYSNLAQVYVQKEKYAEASLLYQRSIELFTSDKDKAVTWNRLGNVYRRLNDYDNAIACYQRADELDPNSAIRSLRSRFSLLGSLSLEPSPNLAV